VTSAPCLTVVIPSHNPQPEKLDCVLKALASQSLCFEYWDVLIIDNCSQPPISVKNFSHGLNIRIIGESRLGLTAARWRGTTDSLGNLVVFVDDDNLLSPNYLEETIRIFHDHPQLGVIGGKSLPIYEHSPPVWFKEGMAPLGCRDLGESIQILQASTYADLPSYPFFAPIGAGMAMRKSALNRWRSVALSSTISDRRGSSLSSAGDCDIVLYALEQGWDIGYFPSLSLSHLISRNRVTEKYLQSISRAAYRDFIRVLDIHGIRPWPSIHPLSVSLRLLKSWFVHQAWRGDEHLLRWHSSIGQYEGRALLGDR
jgi:glycosyltransferase involved in cell wall biosynthesis